MRSAEVGKWSIGCVVVVAVCICEGHGHRNTVCSIEVETMQQKIKSRKLHGHVIDTMIGAMIGSRGRREYQRNEGPFEETWVREYRRRRIGTDASIRVRSKPCEQQVQYIRASLCNGTNLSRRHLTSSPVTQDSHSPAGGIDDHVLRGNVNSIE